MSDEKTSTEVEISYIKKSIDEIKSLFTSSIEKIEKLIEDKFKYMNEMELNFRLHCKDNEQLEKRIIKIEEKSGNRLKTWHIISLIISLDIGIIFTFILILKNTGVIK